MEKKQVLFWARIVALGLVCILNLTLFVLSCFTSYQRAVANQHIYFRTELPTMDAWINSPRGKLSSYIFNVTNAEDFLSGRDDRVKLEQIGPIVYRIEGYSEILNRTDESVTYRRFRSHRYEFVPEESVSPDIMNKTIVQFNTIFLGAGVKFAPMPLATMGFNALSLGEEVFLTGSVYYFLWEYTSPSLKFFSSIMPLKSNCGMLHNALKEREEVYKVNIGPQHGLDDFFHIQTFNGEQQFKERAGGYATGINDGCPINVAGSSDNSLFPPMMTKETPLSIAAIESCRVLPLNYQREQEHNGIPGYRYSLLRANETAPRCMDHTYAVRLPDGMFDASKCVINDAPSAFSMPHFYGTSYNYSEHFEGLAPNVEEHEPHMVLEPKTGIPLLVKYRFMTSTPLPNLSMFHKLSRLSNMIVPMFWYEFDMEPLGAFIVFLVKFNLFVLPVLQPIVMVLQLLCAFWCIYKLLRIWAPSVTLVTVFNLKPHHQPTEDVTDVKDIDI